MMNKLHYYGMSLLGLAAGIGMFLLTITLQIIYGQPQLAMEVELMAFFAFCVLGVILGQYVLFALTLEKQEKIEDWR